jgi:hypothetical protein
MIWSRPKPPPVSVGAVYTAAGGAPTVWRVERRLADGIHVVLVSEDEPTRSKTVAAWVLADPHYFVPARR